MNADKKLEYTAMMKTIQDLKLMQIKIMEDMNDNKNKDSPEFHDLAFKFTVIQTLMFIIQRLI